MPAWSPEVANEFIHLAADERRAFNQLQLQKLVYIAHGHCLAASGQPLTGDRPEAWSFGPVYRRLADALVALGCEPVRKPIDMGSMPPPEFEEWELRLIRKVCSAYGRFSAGQLSTLTRRSNAPWRDVFAEGLGEFRDIPHMVIAKQFQEFELASLGG